MNLRYYEPAGGFLVEDLQMVFPPAANQKLTFVITRKTGEEVARVPLRVEKLRTVKSYRAQVRSGQAVRLARNQMEVEPHTDFIATRLIDVSRTGGCEYCMLDLIWVKGECAVVS